VKHQLVIAIYPESAKLDDITKDLLTSFIVPAVKNYRQQKIDSMNHLHSSYHSQLEIDDTDGGDPALSKVNCDKENLRTVMTLEGELPQINCVMDTLAKSYLEDQIEYLKFSASCSSTQQPNDKMRSFKIVKICEKNMRYDTNITKPKWLPFVENTLTKEGLLDLASRKSIVNFLHHLPSILSKAYVMKTVQDGWIKTGLFPLVILSNWPNYKSLDKEQSLKLLDAIKDLSVKARDHGQLTEEIMESKLISIIGRSIDHVMIEEEKQKREEGNRKGLNEKPINYGRCMWLNNENFIEHQKKLKEQKEMKIEDQLSMKYQKQEQQQMKRQTVEEKRNAAAMKKLENERKKQQKEAERLRKQYAKENARMKPKKRKQTITAGPNNSCKKPRRNTEE